jgi:MYXO-CTERM domain-containing protein
LTGAAPNGRHAASTGTIWGEEGKEMPSVLLLGGSSTGTGKGFAQVVPVDAAAGALGTKDPQKLYVLSTYSDVAGTVVRGKRNPDRQGRGFIYAVGSIPNPGYGKGNAAFMPEIKTFTGAAIQGYTDKTTAALAARESIWLSLMPTTWQAGLSTTPGNATDKPGTNPDGTGPLPRTNVPPTNPSPQASEPPSVVPGGDSPRPPSAGKNDFGDTSSGCRITGSSPLPGSAALLLVLVAIALRRRPRRA